MINSLTISNFQSHKKTGLEFDKGINVIIGPSDSGKTAILRALNWVVNNKPAGDAFRSNWGGDTRAQLQIEDINKSQIQRYKGGKGNLYLWDEKASTILTSQFNSFGQDVPEEIKKLLNFSSLNLQTQFESPFLLSKSGGEVAKYLNKIVHLDKIDLAMSNINSTLRKEKADLEYTTEELKEVEKRSKELDWVEQAEGCLTKLEIAESEMWKKENRITELSNAIGSLENIELELKQFVDLSEYEKQINKLIEKEKKIREKENRAERLDALIENIRGAKNSIAELTNLIEHLQDKFNDLMPEVCPLCGREGNL